MQIIIFQEWNDMKNILKSQCVLNPPMAVTRTHPTTRLPMCSAHHLLEVLLAECTVNTLQILHVRGEMNEF